MAKHILVKAHNNYADEFDVDGFQVFTGEDAEEAIRLVNMFDKVPNSEVCFGTNEWVNMHDTTWTITELSELEYNIIVSTLGHQYGILYVGSMLESIKESSIFVKEQGLLVRYMANFKQHLLNEGKSHWDFLAEVRRLPNITVEGVTFVKTKTWDSETTFSVTKIVDGEEYEQSFDVSTMIAY